MARWGGGAFALALFFLIGSQAFAQIVVRAVVDGDADRVRQEIVSGVDVNMMHPTTGRSLLATAAGRGHAEVVDVLLQAGADVELGWPVLDMSPLVPAATNGHDAVVQLLIGAGANVNHSDGYGATPMRMA